MKNVNKIVKTSIAILILVLFSSCSFEDQKDLNGPNIDLFISNASINQLNNLVVGVESTSRNGLGIATVSTGTLARELYLFDGDPRNRRALLGENGTQLSSGDFYATSPWDGSYRAIKNANLLIEAAKKSKNITTLQKNSYIGFAKTLIALELIELIKIYGKVRIDTEDQSNLGPILDDNTALPKIIDMLTQAKKELNNAGDVFPFKLAGYQNYNSPSTFVKFTNAVLALANVYAGEKTQALTALKASYLDLSGDFMEGPKHVFSQASGDFENPVFKAPSTEENPNNGDQIIVHNNWIDKAEEGDLRVAQKTSLRPNPVSLDGLNGTHETRLYASNVSPIHILRNEELILLYAEANIGSNNSEAIKALNIIRNAFNLSDYKGADDNVSLEKELLKQRKYSLWCENHRMFDLRRYNLSSTLSIDRPGDVVYNQIPVPFSENQ